MSTKVTSTGQTAAITLSGELGPTTRNHVHHVLTDASVAFHALIVDVGDVTFVDTGTVRELLDAARTMEDKGGTFEIRAPRPSFRRALEVLGVTELLAATGDADPNLAPPLPTSRPDIATIGAALRQICRDHRLPRAQARQRLEDCAHQRGMAVPEVAAGIVDGTIALPALPLVVAPTSETTASHEISRRINRQYVVIRATRQLDHDAALALERSVLASADNADVVIDLRDCVTASPDALRVLQRLHHVLSSTRNTLSLREIPAQVIAHPGNADLLAGLPIREDPVPRTRRSGNADPSRR